MVSDEVVIIVASQISPIIPPTISRKFFVGSDLFENRRKAPVLVELEMASW